MPPDTMTLGGHASEAPGPSCQGLSALEERPGASYPSSGSSSAASTTSVWATGASSASGSEQSSQATSPAPTAPGFVLIPQLVHDPVPHCKQYFSWDCGLACVQMILQACGYSQCDYRVLRQLCTTTSIWTVDLAHLLRRFGLRVCFYTVTLGPNPAYANETFYMENMEDDERRVSRLFVEAEVAGIAVQQRSVSSQELQAWLMSGCCLVVALVDKRKLDPWLGAADMCLPALCGMELGYTGHYLLLVGFQAASQEYVVRDPAASEPDLRVSASALDAARRSFGTDEDLLVVHVAPRGGGGGGGVGGGGVGGGGGGGGAGAQDAGGHGAQGAAE